MTLSELKDFAASLQSLTVVFALLVGGTWTAYTFIRLRLIDKAKADLAKAELEARERTVLDVGLELRQLECQGDSSTLIVATVVLKNHGNRGTYVDLRKSILHVAKVVVDSNQDACLSEMRRLPTELGVYVVLPNSEKHLAMLCGVMEKGAYRVDFAVSMCQKAADEASRIYAVDHGWMWSAREYIAIT